MAAQPNSPGVIMADVNLDTAIAELYGVFSAYPLRPHIDSCPCCRGPHTTRHLHTRPLRDLSVEDLHLYVFRAMTTVGDDDDFRHFLPRILELLPTKELQFELDPEIVLGKLRYAKWTTWPAREQECVRQYLHAIWSFVYRHPNGPYPFVPEEIETWLCAIAQAESNLQPYLAAWQADPDPTALENLVAFLGTEQAALSGADNPGPFWEELREQWEQVRRWAEQL